MHFTRTVYGTWEMTINDDGLVYSNCTAPEPCEEGGTGSYFEGLDCKYGTDTDFITTAAYCESDPQILRFAAFGSPGLINTSSMYGHRRDCCRCRRSVLRPKSLATESDLKGCVWSFGEGMVLLKMERFSLNTVGASTYHTETRSFTKVSAQSFQRRSIRGKWVRYPLSKPCMSLEHSPDECPARHP